MQLQIIIRKKKPFSTKNSRENPFDFCLIIAENAVNLFKQSIFEGDIEQTCLNFHLMCVSMWVCLCIRQYVCPSACLTVRVSICQCMSLWIYSTERCATSSIFQWRSVDLNSELSFSKDGYSIKCKLLLSTLLLTIYEKRRNRFMPFPCVEFNWIDR